MEQRGGGKRSLKHIPVSVAEHRSEMIYNGGDQWGSMPSCPCFPPRESDMNTDHTLEFNFLLMFLFCLKLHCCFFLKSLFCSFLEELGTSVAKAESQKPPAASFFGH